MAEQAGSSSQQQPATQAGQQQPATQPATQPALPPGGSVNPFEVEAGLRLGSGPVGQSQARVQYQVRVAWNQLHQVAILLSDAIQGGHLMSDQVQHSCYRLGRVQGILWDIQEVLTGEHDEATQRVIRHPDGTIFGRLFTL